VRVIWGLIAVAGLVAVYYTRSRGGIFGAALGSSVLACGALVIGHQKGAKWFAPALIAIPMIGLGLVTYLFVGWEDAQELRQQSTTVAGMFDNTCRLYFLGMAISCVSLHPFIGGGSQSFSWECFRFANNKLHGDLLTHRPDKVHNEFVQALTDYGIIGAGLLACHFMLNPVLADEHFGGFPEGLEELFPHGADGIHVEFLLEVDDAGIPLAHHLATAGFLKPGDQPQLGGFSGAIHPHQTDPVAGLHFPGDVAQHFAGGVKL
jgi:hypothetical protein